MARSRAPEGMRLDAVVDAGDPRRALAQVTGPVFGRQHDGDHPVGDGGKRMATQRRHHVVVGQEVVGGLVLGHLGVGVVQRVAPAAGRHRREVLLGGRAAVDERLGLQGGQRHRVGPHRRHVIGVELEGQDAVELGSATSGRSCR